MRYLIISLSLLALAVAFAALPALAQDDCAPNVCVDYQGNTLEITPSDGYLQAVVVEERTLTIKGFDGTSTEQQVKVAIFVQDGSTYRLAREDVVPQAGNMRNAVLGDTFILSEVN